MTTTTTTTRSTTGSKPAPLAGPRLHRRGLLGGAAALAGAALSGSKVSAFPAPMLNLRQNGPITLTFWGGEPEESGPGAFIAAFNERDPNVQARYTRYVNDDTGNTQLDTALQGGTPIDVYMTYAVPRLGPRIRARAALDLSPFVAADPEVNAWTEAEADSIFTFEERFYSLPTVRATMVTFANRELLEAAGVTIPERWTTDDFRALAAEVTTDEAFGTYAPPDVARQILGGNYWYKDGGTESNFDHPTFKQSLELHRGMIDEGSSFPWTDVLAQNLRVYQQNVFLTGQATLWFSDLFVLRYVSDLEEFPHEFLTTFAPLPQPSAADPVYNPGSTNNWIMINPKSDYADAAWELIKFRLTDGAQFYLAAGKMPAFPGTEQATIVESILGPEREQLYDVEAFTNAVFDPSITLVTDTITVAGAEILQINQQLSDQYLIGEIELDECLTEMKRQSDEAIRQATS